MLPPGDPAGNRTKDRIIPSRSNRRFRLLFEESPLAMVTLSRRLTITSANRAFAAMLGYAEDQLIGRCILDLTNPADRATCEAVILGADRPEARPVRWDMAYLRADGASIAARVTAQAIRGDEDSPPYALSIVEESAGSKRAESAPTQGREAAVAYLVERARLDGVLLAANLTVDRLGNALSLTRGYNELVLARDELPERAREMLRESLLGLRRAIDLLRELQNIGPVVTRDTPLGPMLDLDASTRRR